MKFRKSQIQQVFIYILAIIVFSMILLYGYKSIKGLGQKADDVILLQLKTKITSTVKKAVSDYGSVIREELDIPGDYDRVCFVDLSKSSEALDQEVCDSVSPDYEPLVCDSWEANAKSNMFLLSKSGDVLTYDIGDIRIEKDEGGVIEYYECINVLQQKIVLRLEGEGDYVLLSEW